MVQTAEAEGNSWRNYHNAIMAAQFSSAVETATLAVEMCEKAGDHRHAGIWQRAGAEALFLSGDSRRAFRSVIRAIREQPDQYERAASLVFAGRYISQAGKHSSALRCFWRAAEIAAEFPHDSYLWTLLYGSRAITYRRIGKPDMAIIDWEGAATLLRENGQYRQAAGYVRDIGDLLARQGSFSQAEQRLSQALELIEQEPNDMMEALICDSLGYMYTLSGDRRQADRFIGKALKIISRIPDKSLLAGALIHSSLLHVQESSFDIARDEAMRALLLAIEDNSAQLVEQARSNIKLALQGQLHIEFNSLFEAHRDICRRALGRAVTRIVDQH